MDKAVEQQVSGSNPRVSTSQLVVKWTQDIIERAKTFFTLTEQEKDAAGIISAYKSDRL